MIQARQEKRGASIPSAFDPAAAPTPSPPQMRTAHPWRRWIRLAEVLVLALVVARFILLPRHHTRGEAPLEVQPRPQLCRQGQPLPRLGASGCVPAGLKEVWPAFLPDVQALAPGSLTAQRTQVVFSNDLHLPVEVVNSVGMHFRLVPPSTFVMGSPRGEIGRWEGETEHVAVVPFALYVGMTEVTQEQWRAVFPGGRNPSYFHGDFRPVEEISWYDCVRFTRALCRREGLAEGVYRLPTEAEWEYACRAGARTAWIFGDDPARLAEFTEFAGNSGGATCVVGRRRPNAFGLYGMHGNVWEWCLDRFRPYPGGPPIKGECASWRVVRSGNWHDPPVNCRSANRCRLPAPSHGNMLGFRTVRVILHRTGKPGYLQESRVRYNATDGVPGQRETGR